MLFSQPELASHLTERFECAWQSLRPAPRVRVDFGDGEVLERTIGGNVITWFCLPDGRAFDVQPGVMTAEGYRGAVDHALVLYAGLREVAPEQLESAAVSIAATESLGWLDYVRRQVAQLSLLGAVSSEGALQSLSALPSPFPATPGFAGFASKIAIEQPLVLALGPIHLNSEVTPLEEDTRLARDTFRPQALGILGGTPLARPSELTRAVYRAILGIDPEDRYLGLRTVLMGRDDGFTDES